MLFDKKSAEENYNVPCRDTGCSSAQRTVKENTVTVDRGSPNCHANMFAAPLRSSPRWNQPPPLPPERLRCSDFVEKLRAYTQAKNFTKSSCHSKHVKSVIKEMIYDSISPKILSKNTIRNSSTRGPEIERDSTKRDNLNPKLHVNGRQEKPNLNRQDPDVRYLCDVTKCLTDTIKQFMDQSTSMTCPGQFLRTQLESQQNSNQRPKSCKCCRVSTTCTCGNKTICTCSCKSNKLEAEIMKWAQTIPVYPNQCINKQNQREIMLKDFIDAGKAFNEALPEEEFKDKMQAIANNMLKTLPMWLPEGQREGEEFKTKLVYDLGERLKKMAPESKSDNSGDSLTDQIMRKRDGFDSGAGVSGLGGRRIRSSSRSDRTMGPSGFDRSMSQESFDTSEFERTAEQEILNYTDPLAASKSMPAKNKRREMAKDLARKAREILFEPEQDAGEQDEMVRDELSQFFRKLSLDTSKPREELVEDLSDKLRSLARSTPKKSKEGFGRGFDETNMSSIYSDEDEETKGLMKQQKAAEKQYVDQLEDVIGSWMDGLPVNLNITVNGRNVKENAKHDIAADVMDREKYNQLHPKVKAIEPEEQDLLKYQIFKRLNNKLKPKDVAIVIPRAESLMKKLKTIAPPDFTKFKAIGKDRTMAGSQEGPGRAGSSGSGGQRGEVTSELMKQQKAAENQYLDQLENVIGSWMDGLPVNLDVTVDGINVQDNAKQNIAADVLDREKYKQLHPKEKATVPEELEMLEDHIFKRLNNKLQPKDVSTVISRAESLMKKLKTVPPPDFIKFKTLGKGVTMAENKGSPWKAGSSGSGSKQGEDQETSNLMKQQRAAKNQYQLGVGPEEMDNENMFGGSNHELFEKVEKWVKDLPIPSNTPEEKEKGDNMKQELANKLITKIAGMHMDPHILNDDYAYDSIVKDEIGQFLEEIPQSPEIVQKKEALKADLVEKVKEIQQKAKEEFAGHAFNHQLRDTVTKSLPKTENIEPTQQATLEIIKDDIADALIDMNYEPDAKRREELQKKVEEKIQNYADEIEKIEPGINADTAKIKKDLVAGIKKVPVPNKDFIKGEVEQVRLKNEIKEWAKELPLKPDLKPEEQIRANKMIALTAKNLHKIEKEKANNPNVNYDRITQREIGKLIKKLPLMEEEVNVPEITRKLFDKLKSTEDSRQMKSNPRTSVADDDNYEECPPCKIPPCVRAPCGLTPPCNPPQPCDPAPSCSPKPPCFHREPPCRTPPPCRVSPCARPTWQPRTPKPRHTSRNMSCNQPSCNYHPKKHDCLNQKPCERPHYFRPHNHPCHSRFQDQDEESYGGNDVEEQHSPRSDDGVERCPRCCGMSCPHPSHLYFRN